MRISRMVVAAAGLSLCLAGLAATAGVVIEQEQSEPGSDTPAWRTTYFLDAGKLRIEAKSAEGEETLTIFDEARQVVWMIDRLAGTYVELTPAQVHEMQQRLEQARKEMEAELARMPPDKRQAIEEMMKGQTGGGAAITVREAGRGEKVGSYLCVRYELLTQGQRAGEVWAAPFEQLQIRDPEAKTFQALARFLEPLGQGLPGGGRMPGGSQVQGFPVRSVTYDGERVVAEEKLVKAERRTLDPGLFTLPAGLQKTEFGPEE